MLLLSNGNDSAMTLLDYSMIDFSSGKGGNMAKRNIGKKGKRDDKKKILGKGGNKTTKILPKPVPRAAAAHGRQLKR